MTTGIVIGVFVLVVLIFVFLARDSTLEKTQLLASEEQVFEEQGVRVVQSGRGHPVIFNNCKILATNRRIIIGQKVALASSHALRFIVIYKDPNPEDTKLRMGYLSLGLSPEEISFGEDEGKEMFCFSLGGVSMAAGQQVKVFSQKLEEFRKLLSQSA